jgi:hypothetical protein
MNQKDPDLLLILVEDEIKVSGLKLVVVRHTRTSEPGKLVWTH